MHIKVMGQGPDLVMLHGWSMHSAVWHDIAEGLAQNFTLHLVDLPGHGQSDWHDDALNLDVVVDNLAKQLPESAYYLGWSLGGLINIAFARQHPERVKKLILLAATPCFVQSDDWTCAMDVSIFNTFAEQLNEDQETTLQRFLLLQARGSQHSRETIKVLTSQLTTEHPPKYEALKAGLALLIDTDLRTAFSDLTCPVKMILGDRDTLIPHDMLNAVKQLKSTVETTLLIGAGHAPFIAQAAQCQHEIEAFLNE